MTTTRKNIENWIEEAQQYKATYLIVACDTFDHGDYPVYAKDKEECLKKVSDRHGKNMQKVMEVYNLNMDIEKQLNERRSWNV